MPEYTLKIRRFDPESGEAAYWDEHQVELGDTQLGARRDPQGPGRGRRLGRDPLLLPAGDLRLVRGAHERQAGAGLQHPPRGGGGRAATAAGWQPAEDDGDGPRRRVIEVEPMGNMPVIRDLIVDMDAVHWKKIQRVTPVPDQQGAGPRARVHRAPREHGRHHPDDGLHPVRRLRVGLPVDGDRPAVHRPGRAGQGLPLRRRPARRRAPRAAQGPRPRTSTASTTAPTASTASTPAPRTSRR